MYLIMILYFLKMGLLIFLFLFLMVSFVGAGVLLLFIIENLMKGESIQNGDKPVLIFIVVLAGAQEKPVCDGLALKA